MKTVEGNCQIKRTDLQATLTLNFAVVGAQICHQSDNQIWSYFSLSRPEIVVWKLLEGGTV